MLITEDDLQKSKNVYAADLKRFTKMFPDGMELSKSNLVILIQNGIDLGDYFDYRFPNNPELAELFDTDLNEEILNRHNKIKKRIKSSYDRRIASFNNEYQSSIKTIKDSHEPSMSSLKSELIKLQQAIKEEGRKMNEDLLTAKQNYESKEEVRKLKSVYNKLMGELKSREKAIDVYNIPEPLQEKIAADLVYPKLLKRIPDDFSSLSMDETPKKKKKK